MGKNSKPVWIFLKIRLVEYIVLYPLRNLLQSLKRNKYRELLGGPEVKTQATAVGLGSVPIQVEPYPTGFAA